MVKIQCPNCLTNFAISKERLSLSQGKVRCGNCLERFDPYQEAIPEKPVFDPRDAFIEPLSYAEEAGESELVKKLLSNPQKIQFKDESLGSVDLDQIVGISKSNITDKSETEEEPEPSDEKKIIAPQKDTSKSKHPIKSDAERGLVDNLDLELSVHLFDDDFSESTVQVEHSIDSNSQLMTDVSIQFDEDFINEPSIQIFDQPLDEPSIKPKKQEPTLLEEPNDKLEEPTLIEPENVISSNDDHPLIFDDIAAKDIKSKSSFFKFVSASFSLILISFLSISLIFQLWQKQLIHWPDNNKFQTTIAPVVQPIVKELNKHNIKLPVRRSIGSLQLISAKTEPHPTRSATLLLKLSLINKADIDQPLPWLELSLNNSEGRVISRRSLSPKDYIHNNRINTSIGANELKKITVELLSFPRNAAGYEIRVINK